MGVLRYLFSFKGRINRAKLWLFFPIALVWMFGTRRVIAAAIDVPSLWDIAEQQGGSATILDLLKYRNGAIAIGSFFAAMIPVIYVALAVMGKRLHDRNKSAAWLLLYWLVPQLLFGTAVGLWMASGMAEPGLPSMIALLVAFGVSIWSFVEIVCLPGTPGTNRFGPDPLKPSSQ